MSIFPSSLLDIVIEWTFFSMLLTSYSQFLFVVYPDTVAAVWGVPPMLLSTQLPTGTRPSTNDSWFGCSMNITHLPTGICPSSLLQMIVGWGVPSTSLTFQLVFVLPPFSK